MYSKRAKYKQVANIDWLSSELMELIARNHMSREQIDSCVHADYYWLPGLGLYVILDAKGKDILTCYRGYTLLSSRACPLTNTYGRFVCSNE